jgi:hypothetical protein
MRRFILSLALLVSLTPALARNHRGSTISINTEDDEPLTRCDQIRATFNDERVPVIEQDLGGSGIRSLHVDAARNGGVYVSGADVSTYSVKACKAAATSVDVNSVRVGLRGDTTYVDGPDDSDWVVYFIVTAPRSAVLELSAHNGPISVRDVSGSIKAEVQNGPISLKNDGGTIDARATNGPVSFSGDSGDVKLRAQNGPVSVHLTGSSWNSGSLDASTQNGPLSLKLPAGYRSGVLAESDGHGPVSCRAEACRSAMRTHPSSDDEDDWPRRLEFGSGPMVVHLSTVNGPLSVKEQ